MRGGWLPGQGQSLAAACLWHGFHCWRAARIKAGAADLASCRNPGERHGASAITHGEFVLRQCRAGVEGMRWLLSTPECMGHVPRQGHHRPRGTDGQEAQDQVPVAGRQVGQRTNRGKTSHSCGSSRFRLAPPTCENGDINARKGGTVMASSPSHCGTRRGPRHLPPLPGLRAGRAARPTRCLGITNPWPSPVPNRQGMAPICANFGHSRQSLFRRRPLFRPQPVPKPDLPGDSPP